MQNFKKFLKVIAAVAVVGAVGYGGYFGYQKFFNKQEEPPAREGMNMANIFAQAEVSDVKEIVSATGVVKLKDEQAVYATTKTRVKEVAVEVGDMVQLGQVLVTYDVETTRDDLTQQIRQAEITLSNNQLSLKSLNLPKSQSEINQLKSNIDTAERSVDDAIATLEGTEAKIIQQQNEIVLAEKEIEKAENEILRAEKDIEKAEKDIQKANDDIAKADQDIVTSQILLDAGAITREDHNKTVDARDVAVTAYENSITARDNTLTARDNTIYARDNAIESKNKAQNSLEDLIRQKEANQRSIEAAQKNVELAQTKLADAIKDQQSTKASDEINYQKQVNQVASSEINLRDLRDQLSKIVDVTTSPLSGTVTEVAVDKGSTVDVDTALIKVADLSQLIVTADISEYDAPNIAVGQEVIMTSDGIPGVTYFGKIISISNEAMTQTAVSGTETVVPIEISVDNPDGKVKAGFNLDLEITTVDKPEVLNVASTAVVNDYKAGKKYVFTVDNERNLKKTEVETGIVSGAKTEIVSGIVEGDRVISTPTDTMEDGMPLMDAMQGMGLGSGEMGGRQGQGNTMVFGRPSGGGQAIRVSP